MQQENLSEMLKELNKKNKPSKFEKPEIKTSEEVPDKEEVSEDINITNFYDWFEVYALQITNVAHVKTQVANINEKDSMILKTPKTTDPEIMELISFYKPSIRPILNLPPVQVKIFKNDTFEVLHAFNQNIFIKSYGVKTGLIVVFCVNVDGKIIPFEKCKVKKNVTSVRLSDYSDKIALIKSSLQEQVDSEAIMLLYKQASDVDFTTKESALDWFLKRQSEVIDINHLLKIDNVLINVI
jgi:hypothetical protein